MKNPSLGENVAKSSLFFFWGGATFSYSIRYSVQLYRMRNSVDHTIANSDLCVRPSVYLSVTRVIRA